MVLWKRRGSASRSVSLGVNSSKPPPRAGSQPAPVAQLTPKAIPAATRPTPMLKGREALERAGGSLEASTAQASRYRSADASVQREVRAQQLTGPLAA
jgi:hypothetical protein